MDGNLSIPQNKISSLNFSVSYNENVYETLENNSIPLWQVKELNSTKKNISAPEIICEKLYVDHY